MKLGTLCYIEKDNQVLMLHRIKKENDFHQGFWVGLGGKLEKGESPEDCVIREVLEESGLTVTRPSLRGVMTFPGFGFEEEDWYVFLFSADTFSGELIDSPEGVLQWIPKERMKDLPMHTGDYLFLSWMDKYPFFSAKLNYEGETLLGHEVIPHITLYGAVREK